MDASANCVHFPNAVSHELLKQATEQRATKVVLTPLSHNWPAHATLASCFVIVALGFLSPAPARAQQPALDDLAAQVAQSLRVAKQSKVAVFDFAGPGRPNLTALGTKLADDFSLALARSGEDLRVDDRSQMRLRMQQEGYTFDGQIDPLCIVAFARDLKADAIIAGTISREGDKVRLSVRASRVTNGKLISSGDTWIGVTDQTETLLTTYLATGDLSIPTGGQNGYSSPVCVYCPTAQFTDDAVRARFNGRVILVAIIGADGRASVVKVIKGAPFGLSEKAVDAVRQWRFKPARGPDGKAAAVRTDVQVAFHIGS